ncbi:hypothetical protein BU24DRAFT_422506 [Aaosphaeria arxii CBS 175.79]|uniref:Ribosomal protein L9 domain-containing protein n=1 Tax=Aaosphaeria arxii CBS 175.79 TaxID=1450172 RepID=A0A6A5XV84_9PLEO|nr:uncharacterized protein BU24DRAFT_422506 [Aaosphaeria arxii CBS 175.79]KAF2016164.1 hypothetical protein BU24DRAFT_422506 [Aaosphaeria arxii CBS 175.79]
MASLGRLALRPQCTSCTRRITQLGLDAWRPQQQVRNVSKAVKEAERNIVVKLLKDINRFGPAGSYVPVNRSMMRNRWFPSRTADYVPFTQLKQLKAEGVSLVRDTEFGLYRAPVEDEDASGNVQAKPYVRPVEIDVLSPERAMELLTTFAPPTIDFTRQPIDQDQVLSKPRYGATGAADILTAAAMSNKPKTPANGIYGSVSTADVVASIRAALSHNDEAARVIITENDIRFIEGHAEGDESRVKQLGKFKVEITVPGAEAPIIRSIRIRAKE